MKLLREQGGKCPLCLQPIDATKKGTTDYVLDHCHDTGQVRGVLHRHCNRAEAKVFQAVQSWGAQGKDVSAVIDYLGRLVDYWKQEKQPVIYHLHKTEDEKREARNAKQRKARAKAAAIKRLQGK